MSCIKKWAYKEPLVECINGKSLNSECEAFLDIDLLKVKKEDLDFSNKY
jgi:protein arginine N-methyltransferase 1